MGSDDAAWVEALRAKDATAFARVYAEYHTPIFRFLLRLSGQRALAEDLFQETWLAVARDASRIAPDSELRAWLFAVARNRYRSHRRWSMLDLTRVLAFAKQAVTEAPSHEGASAARAEGRLAERAFARLRDGEREVLLLSISEGLEGPELGQALGISAQAARQRLHRARAALAAQMERAGRPARQPEPEEREP